jgi:phosphoglycerol transferase MdoB-like AlkP superfamily enzyme
MLSKILFIVKYWLAWIVFFELARLVFLLSNYSEFKQAGLDVVIPSLWYGLRMDLSLSAYLTLPVALCINFSDFFPFCKKPRIYIIYTAMLLFFVSVILMVDIGLFQAWGSRIDSTPLKYLSNPKEAWASVNHLPVATIGIAFLMMYLLLSLGSKRLLTHWVSLISPTSFKLLNSFLLFVITVFFIIPIRGGFQLAPLNQSSVYFSQNNFANLAALNAPWNFIHSIRQHSLNTVNPFKFESESKAKWIADSLLGVTKDYRQMVDIKKDTLPNVIIIVWESFTAKAVGLQMEGKKITPGFNSLMTEGLYFPDIYATGDRTDKGIVGVLSGYPSQAITSIIKEPTKAAKLPMLSKVLQQRGYHTSFHYGGELEFANMKAYLLQGKFNQFVTISDFDKKDQNSKWGAHDGVVAKRLFDDINLSAQPFFSTWLTLSSHEPYEIPTVPILKQTDDVSQFLSSIHYTDSIVFDFVQQAKKQSWWKNTLVVILADHGHRLPRSVHKPDDFKIPLLMLGGLIKQPRMVSGIGSQTDIAATVLSQLHLNHEEFKWSRNLFDSTRSPWAFFTFTNGFGFIEPEKKLVFDNVGKMVMEKSGEIQARDIFFGKALQQAAFQDYMDK